MKFINIIKNNYYDVLNEENELKYYCFDIDDNLLTTSTKMKMLYKGQPKEISTEEFAKVRNEIGKGEWELPKNAYDNFSVKGDKEFLKDIITATPAPAWDDFVECINSASLFAIITARGHSPETIKQGIKNLIENNVNGLDKEECEENIDKFRELVGKNIKSNKLDYYLNMCRFYPVSNEQVKNRLGVKSGSAANPEVLKTKAFDEFRKYVSKQGGKIKKRFNERNIWIGFSDDDQKNIDKMKEHILKTKNKYKDILRTYVKDTGKTPEKEIYD